MHHLSHIFDAQKGTLGHETCQICANRGFFFKISKNTIFSHSAYYKIQIGTVKILSPRLKIAKVYNLSDFFIIIHRFLFLIFITYHRF